MSTTIIVKCALHDSITWVFSSALNVQVVALNTKYLLLGIEEEEDKHFGEELDYLTAYSE
jgi:hypothetical protein